MTFAKPVRPGTIVIATTDIIEDGFMFPGEEWGHATEGDVGIVVFWDANTKYPTVRFIKSGTATVVDSKEIRRVAIDDGPSEADRIASSSSRPIVYPKGSNYPSLVRSVSPYSIVRAFR